eukprot:CAMPEP_0173455224 /NCGR_PEP_ID=MMETSP1357-20121228/53903_1 /TAXON_ID=77926 /ORGANISM="Hemiselmis rufescens, Strain PCC563" /LENGTH=41 /DNA_ID= /DNA_START= /DNA_END= /DNA_ORIENTATION=
MAPAMWHRMGMVKRSASPITAVDCRSEAMDPNLRPRTPPLS